MTSHPTIQTHSQSCALEECQEVLNVPSTSTAGNELMEEGEFLSFSNCHTPIGTALPDPSTPTPAPRPPNSSRIYSAEDCFANTIPILDYVHTSWMSGGRGGGDSNLPSPGPPSIPLPNSPAPSNNTLTPDPLLLFVQAVQVLTRVASASADRDSSSGKTKVHEPDTFNGTDPHKLHAFLVLCELNFQNRPKAFATDHAKVTYTQSYLRGMAFEWFKLDLLNVSNPNAHPIWMDNYHQFVSKLKSNFGPHDPVRDAEHQLDNLSMKEGQKINKYVVEFNHLARQVHGYGDGTLCHIFYSGLLTTPKMKSPTSESPAPSMVSTLSHRPSMPGTGNANPKSCAKPRTLLCLPLPTQRALPALLTPRASPRRRITRARALTTRTRVLPAPLALQS